MSRILQEIREKRQPGEPVVGAAVGAGFIGRCLCEAGVDFLAVYSGSIMHMRGNDAVGGLLPVTDANESSFAVGRDVLAGAEDTPVFIGLAAWDPLRTHAEMLHRVRETGYAGIVNFPTVGFYDGVMRAYVERTGFSYEREARLVLAATQAGLSACAFAFTPDEAAVMASAGAEIMVLSTPGGDHASDAIAVAADMAKAARATGASPVLLCQGGPLSEPSGVEAALRQIPELDGYFGARALVAAPIHEALKAKVEAYRCLRTDGGGNSVQ